MSFKRRVPQSSDGVQKAPIRVFVATPAYDGKVHTDYAQALADTCITATMMGIQMKVCTMRNGAFIDMARNICARLFLETDCTHLLFIDSDLKWEPYAFAKLVTSGKPVCAGAYRKRQDKEEYPVRTANREGDGCLDIRDIDENGVGWIMCDRVATGFLCIERSVIEKMVSKATLIKDSKPDEPSNPKLFYTYINEDNRFVGEDFAFCDDYRKQFGEKIWAWPDLNFTHDRWEGNWHKFLLSEMDKIERGEKSDTLQLKELPLNPNLAKQLIQEQSAA